MRSANSKRFTQSQPERRRSLTTRFRPARFLLVSEEQDLRQGLAGSAGFGRPIRSPRSISRRPASFSKYSDVEDTGLGLFVRSAAIRRRPAARPQPGAVSSATAATSRVKASASFNLAKYVSPEFSGFVASASWGEDDFWDVALNYEGEFSGFKIAAGIGYGEITDNSQTNTVCAAQNAVGGQRRELPAVRRIDQRDPRSLGPVRQLRRRSEDRRTHRADRESLPGTGVDDGQTFWATQVGIEKKWHESRQDDHLRRVLRLRRRRQQSGATSVQRDALNPTGAGNWALWGTGVEVIGAGIAQGIDKAAMIVYLSYRHVEGDVTLREKAGGVRKCR